MIIMIGCSKDEKSGEKNLISFSIPNQTCDVTIDGQAVSIKMYKHVDIGKLTPIVVVSDGATVNPSSGVMVDFTNPVFYVVTAQDGSVATYVVTVQKTLSRKNDIENFQLVGTEQIFEREGDNLFVYVPYETDIASIVAEIVVSDKATVTPASGVQIDFTNPQTYTVKSSDGTEKEFLVTVKKSPWRKITSDAPFSKRDGSGLVEFKGKMWLLGGWLSLGDISEVWNTSDGINWDFVGDAPWEGRHSTGFVVYKDFLWVISGDGHPDVWKTGDGENWELVTANAPWGNRSGSYIGVFNDKLWLIGGVDWWNEAGEWVREFGTKGLNDVWSSIDGKDWKRELEFAPFAQRGMIHGFTVLNNELYIYGGGTRAIFPPYSAFNDVWKTTNGVIWHNVTHHANWSPRLHFSAIVYDNKLWVTDGTSYTENLMNDVWYSNDGKDWTQLKHSFFPARHASSLCVFQGKLWMVAGFILNDIWVLSNDYE